MAHGFSSDAEAHLGPSMAANRDVDVLRSNRAACAASLIIFARAASSLHASSSREQRLSVSRAAFSWGAFAANSRLPAL